ncbi:hypothetical protein [Vibrio phage BONAISHI]|nr:hypothetical protein [Vibrio phage BONAISHI]
MSSLFGPTSNASRDAVDDLEVKESNWINQAFFKPKQGLSGITASRRLGGAGNQAYGPRSLRNSFNFYDTTLGGNKSINPPPQYTRYADPKDIPIISKSAGMGRYYKEAIFQNQQRLSCCAGIPEYNPLSRYFINFIDLDHAMMVNKGRLPLAYKAGYATGFLFTLPFQAVFGIASFVNRVIKFISNVPYSKYYYLKPQSTNYWNSVSLLFNKLAVDMGALRGVTPADLVIGEDEVRVKEDAKSNLGVIASRFPDVLRPVGDTGDSEFIIDVKSVSSRAQRMANLFESRIDYLIQNIDPNALDPTEDLITQLRALQNSGQITPNENSPGIEPEFLDMPSYMEAYSQSGIYRFSDLPAENVAQGVDNQGRSLGLEATDAANANSTNNTTRDFVSKQPTDDTLGNYLLAELREGSLFSTFDVEYTGPTTVSVSNSVKEAAIKSALNGASSAASDLRVNTAGGNVGDNIFTNAAESMLGTVRDFIAGNADSVGLGITGSLLGLAKAQIPNVYDDSSVTLPSHTYKIRLATPYGNRFSILTRIYMPLCMIMALAFPRSTGKNSYGPPFLVHAHSQGIQDTKLGIVTDLSMEIGTSNIGRTPEKLPTAIDVSITISSLDDTMSIPIMDSLADSVMSFSPFDEDTPLTDFLTTLASTPLQDQYYMANRVARAWNTQQANWASFTSPSYWMQEAAATGIGQLISAMQKVGDI